MWLLCEHETRQGIDPHNLFYLKLALAMKMGNIIFILICNIILFNIGVWRRWGTEAEFQLPLKGPAPSRCLPQYVAGWHQGGHPTTKTCFIFRWLDSCLMVTKWNDFQNGSVTKGWLSTYSALGKQPSDLCLDAQMPDLSYLRVMSGSRTLNDGDDDDVCYLQTALEVWYIGSAEF